MDGVGRLMDWFRPGSKAGQRHEYQDFRDIAKENQGEERRLHYSTLLALNS